MFNRTPILAALLLAAAAISQAAITSLTATPASVTLPQGTPGGSAVSTTFQLQASGTGMGNFAFNPSADWLSGHCMNCPGGNSITVGTPLTISVVGDPSQLPAKNGAPYTGTLVIYIIGSSVTLDVSVSFTVQGTDVDLSVTTMTFSYSNPAPQNVTVTVSGGATGILYNFPSWITVSGNLSNASSSFVMTISVKTAGLNPSQTLSDFVTLSQASSNQPFLTTKIAVYLPAVQLTLSPSTQNVPLSATLGSTATVMGSAMFTAAGLGSQPVILMPDSAWLTATASPTTIAAGGNLTINVFGNPKGLPAGPQMGSVSVIAGSAGATITVTLNIAAAPVITSLNPPSTSAGGPTFPLTVNGSGFSSGSTVEWNGSPLTTTFGSATVLTATVPMNQIASPGSASITVASAGLVSNVVTFTVNPTTSLTQGTLANGATYVAGGLVPGSWAQVKGVNLGSVARTWASSDFAGLGNNLPTNLSGVQVMVNNLPAAVYYISPTQINFQVPTGVTGTASVQVTNNGLISNTVSAPSAVNAPGLFPITLNGVNYPAAVFAADNLLVGDPAAGPTYRKAKPGETVELYATGLIAEPGGVLPTAQGVPGVTITIGSVIVPADFAGQLQDVIEFQINFKVPQQFGNMPAGSYPISIQVNGASSPTTIQTSSPGPLVFPIQP